MYEMAYVYNVIPNNMQAGIKNFWLSFALIKKIDENKNIYGNKLQSNPHLEIIIVYGTIAKTREFGNQTDWAYQKQKNFICRAGTKLL